MSKSKVVKKSGVNAEAEKITMAEATLPAQDIRFDADDGIPDDEDESSYFEDDYIEEILQTPEDIEIHDRAAKNVAKFKKKSKGLSNRELKRIKEFNAAKVQLYAYAQELYEEAAEQGKDPVDVYKYAIDRFSDAIKKSEGKLPKVTIEAAKEVLSNMEKAKSDYIHNDSRFDEVMYGFCNHR